MSATAKKTDPALWEKIKATVQAGTRGGEAGEWSARKAQLAVSDYKKAGGGYDGRKDPHNHLVDGKRRIGVPSPAIPAAKRTNATCPGRRATR